MSILEYREYPSWTPTTEEAATMMMLVEDRIDFYNNVGRHVYPNADVLLDASISELKRECRVSEEKRISEWKSYIAKKDAEEIAKADAYHAEVESGRLTRKGNDNGNDSAK